ncbi:MAG: LacI family DNA-binding transcriptional regulator [Flavobacterium sp.]
MRVKATLKQIAKDLGFSVSTVSKALSDSHEISDLTKKKVQEYAKLQNYKPNSMAKNLKNQKTNTIGVIIPNILNPFFAKVFSGIEKTANDKGYNVITYISNESYKKEKDALDLLSSGTVDGFIISVAEETQMTKEFYHIIETIKQGLPIVMFDRVTDEVTCDKVVVDDLESSVHAVNHLIASGCKKIAMLSCIDNLSVGKLRVSGYKKALSDYQFDIDENLILVADKQEDFDAQLSEFLEQQQPDAIFAADEHASTYAMKLSLKNGVKIPEELSVIGFADGIWSRRLTPSLSTISQHGPEIGALAAEKLIIRLESKEENLPFETHIVHTELRQRDSTRKL